MAKFKLKIEARNLRRNGKSIKSIAELLNVSKSTVSLWCRDIVLTREQIEKLLKSKEEGIKLGQFVAAKKKRELRLKKIKSALENGQKEFENVTSKELFISGVSLYVAEGSKKDNKLAFTNSDPRLVKFMTLWFKKFFNIPKDSLVFSIIIHESHKKRLNQIILFWSKFLNVNISQFRKTTFISSKSRKIYENPHLYFGTIKVRALKSADFCYKMNGLIQAFIDRGLSNLSKSTKSA